MIAPDVQVGEAVLRYISGARWYAGKGRRAVLRSVTPLPWLTDTAAFGSPTGDPAVRMEIAEIAYESAEDLEPAPEAADDRDPDQGSVEPTEPPRPAGPNEYYQLVVSYRPAPREDLHHAEIVRSTDVDLGPVVGYDAAQDPEACAVLVRCLLGGRRLRSPDTEVRFCPSGTVLGLSGGSEGGRPRSEQHVPTSLEPRVYKGQQSNTSVMLGDVAILKFFRRLELGRNLDIEVHAALNNAKIDDVARLYGWIEGGWLSGGRYHDTDLGMMVQQLADAEDGWERALHRLRQEESFVDDARALGRTLAQTHQALHAAFPTARVLGAHTAAVMSERLATAVGVAPALLSHRDGLLECFDALGTEILDTQRVHGDFHLGQTLHTPDGWRIIDFEGEPAKTMAERRTPDSVWRDVAGMLRSFDYAAASVTSPASPGWAAACREAFLDGYSGGGLSDAEVAVLRAYEADKAIYEVIYEVRNRPDWVSIPMGAVASLAVASTGPKIDPAQTETAFIPGGAPPEPPEIKE